jgi:hypothetical protein
MPLVQPALDAVTYFRLSAKRMLWLSLSAGVHSDAAAHVEPLPVPGVDGFTEADVAEIAAQREEETQAAVVEYLTRKVEENSPVDKVGVWHCLRALFLHRVHLTLTLTSPPNPRSLCGTTDRMCCTVRYY